MMLRRNEVISKNFTYSDILSDHPQLTLQQGFINHSAGAWQARPLFLFPILADQN
jgi:hypothetical protein